MINLLRLIPSVRRGKNCLFVSHISVSFFWKTIVYQLLAKRCRICHTFLNWSTRSKLFRLHCLLSLANYILFPYIMYAAVNSFILYVFIVLVYKWIIKSLKVRIMNTLILGTTIPTERWYACLIIFFFRLCALLQTPEYEVDFWVAG